MNCNPHWTSYISALLTPIVACLGIYIAFRQWKTAQNKQKHDLFDRRFTVYDEARKFIASIMTSGRVNDEELYKFLYGTREAKWLFDLCVEDYLDKELHHKALYLQALASDLEDMSVGSVRNSNVQKQLETKQWFLKQYDVLDTKFSPFLSLKH